MPIPPAPPNNLPLASSLPRVSFRRIPDEEATKLAVPAGVYDQQNVNFGFNDGSPFEKPEHYLRFVEPIESDLKRQVEYDMDEQDQEWLDALNQDRRKDQLDAITYELFEIIMDRLEKEWFDLMMRVPPKQHAVQTGEEAGEDEEGGGEDTACAICDDGECENSNAIVFCDGCNLAVHQDCYGIPYIPEGQWLCRKCTVSPDRAVSCILCPNEGGAFKQTTQGKWAHLLCAMWIPETGVSNPVYMEPIDSVERVPKARWKLQCCLCRHRSGACIQCDNKSCFTAFHVTCARRVGLLIKGTRQRATHGSDSDSDNGSDALKALCRKHLPKHMRKAQLPSKLKMTAEQSSDESGADDEQWQHSVSPRKRHRGGGARGNSAASPYTTKSARAYKRSYRAVPPLVPAYVVRRVLEYITKVNVRKKPELVSRVARFWSLKREARRGAPLLKRLHLEPWTASSANQEQTDAERMAKFQYLLRLREDLEKIRMLAELVRKREKEKLRQAQLLRSSLVDGVLLQQQRALRCVLEKAMAADRTGLFLHPVSRQEVPDYYEIVKQPMDWTTIGDKLDALQYDDVDDFRGDVLLVVDNAMLYNKADTAFHRLALRIKSASQHWFAEVEPMKHLHEGRAQLAGSNSEGRRAYEALSLEPEDSVLHLLAEYDRAAQAEAMGANRAREAPPRNAVEDLTRQYYSIDPPESPSPPTARKAKMSAKLARQARAQKAAETRKKARAAREAVAAAKGAASGEVASGPATVPPPSAARGKITRSVVTRGGRAETMGPRAGPRRLHANAGQGASEAKRVSALQASRAAVLARKRRKEEADKASGVSRKLRVVTRDEEASQGDAVARKRRRRHSSSSPDEEEKALLERRDKSLPEPTHLEVEQVDSWDSFKRFNVGWVLPEGTRRSRHMSGTAANTGGVTGIARSPSDGPQPSIPDADVEQGSLSELSEPDEDVGINVSEVRGGRSSSVEEREPRPSAIPSRLVSAARSRRDQRRGSHGQFIRKDESLNKTRAPRGQGKAVLRARAAAMATARRRTKNVGQAAGAAAQSSPLTSEAEAEDADEEADEEDEGEGGDDAVDTETVAEERKGVEDERRQRQRKLRLQRVREQHAGRDRLRRRREAEKMRRSTSGASERGGCGSVGARGTSREAGQEPLEVGTLVWAKTTGYPYFPAEIWDEFGEVPDEVLAKRDDAQQLVRFFDNGRSFSWLPPSRLRLMAEDEAIDRSMLSQPNLSAHHRNSVRAAYQRARAAEEL